jgi:arylsulfatase A-like enzyme
MWLTRLLLPALAAVLVLTGIATLTERWRGRGAGILAIMLASGAALAFFLRWAYVYNRFHYSPVWLKRRPFSGVSLPDALFHWQVWRTNLLIALGAIAIGIAAWLLLRWILRQRRPHRLWRAAGHPAATLAAAALVGLPLVGGSLLRQRSADRPGFVLVSLDTLRADHLGVYGYPRDTSPEMDRLAEESLLFEWTISQAPNTSPSDMSNFTSLYPTVHGFTGDRDRLAGWRLTLAEYLRDTGYRTAATTDGAYMRGWFGFAQGFERFADHMKGMPRSVSLAFDWLDSGLGDSPFFLFVHTYDIHSPYDPPLPFRDMFTDPAYDGGFHPGSQELEEIRKRVKSDPEGGHGLTPEDIAFIKARYDGGIRYTDREVGRLVEGLRSRGILDRAWLIITSDHGEEFTEHGSVLHEKLYHTVTRVPLLVRPPGPSRSGRRVPEIVELIDIMPTILDLAGIEPVRPLQGRSLLPLITGAPESWKETAFSEHAWEGRRRAVTSPSLHVLTSLQNGELEVYDYHADPLEQRSLAEADPARETRSLLRALLDWSLEQSDIAAREGTGTESLALDAEAEAELRGLGYVQ